MRKRGLKTLKPVVKEGVLKDRWAKVRLVAPAGAASLQLTLG